MWTRLLHTCASAREARELGKFLIEKKVEGVRWQTIDNAHEVSVAAHKDNFAAATLLLDVFLFNQEEVPTDGNS